MKQRGFTLVEVLVALLAMAVLGGFAWRGLEGVIAARDANRAAIDSSTRLATVLMQWEQDLVAVRDTGTVPALVFDGQSLRLTRRADTGVVLVVWAVRSGRWQRWASAPIQRSGALQRAWMASQQFLGDEPGQLTVADAATEWQLYFWRGNEWSNAQSTGNLVAPAAGGVAPQQAGAAREELPRAVRLQITLGGRKLTRDIALGPSGA